jgi:hypothetical protein
LAASTMKEEEAREKKERGEKIRFFGLCGVCL